MFVLEERAFAANWIVSNKSSISTADVLLKSAIDLYKQASRKFIQQLLDFYIKCDKLQNNEYSD